ncbi:hypothetical protein JYU34_018360 [Plutella xylostella]|uniref:Uncharacterized protein n=1 Tax=Plutella xylostella TaxID=51655 RepID=A0ABQ7PY40_PLUXY|nr:hypothetical protein JYU34_018360 [Plutella xylostella]
MSAVYNKSRKQWLRRTFQREYLNQYPSIYQEAAISRGRPAARNFVNLRSSAKSRVS